MKRRPNDGVGDRDRGDSTLLLVGCVVALILSVGLVVDGSARLRADDQAQFAADQAARAAGQHLVVGAYRETGRAVLDAPRAVAAAEASLRASGVTGTVAVAGDAVTVDTSATTATVFLGIIGIDRVTGHGHAVARAHRGITQEGQ